MKANPEKWLLIDRMAGDAGVPKDTRKKWRVRGVPAKWRIRLVLANPFALSFDDFEGGPSQSGERDAA